MRPSDKTPIPKQSNRVISSQSEVLSVSDLDTLFKKEEEEKILRDKGCGGSQVNKLHTLLTLTKPTIPHHQRGLCLSEPSNTPSSSGDVADLDSLSDQVRCIAAIVRHAGNLALQKNEITFRTEDRIHEIAAELHVLADELQRVIAKGAA